MKVIIQIPCWNEEQTLPVTINALPKTLPGVDVVETLIVDDGSTDRTVAVAKELGVTHVVELVTHQGLASAFQRGILECLRRGADVIVNTDADNQYQADDMHKLVAPILAGQAEYVIGDRDVQNLPHFSWLKKKLHGVGTSVVRAASNTDVRDTPSGYRAIARDAALQLFVHSDYTYTHETLIQAGLKGIPLKAVPIRVNPATRPSRLFRSIPRYVLRSANGIARIYLIYNAYRVLSRLGMLSGFLGVVLVALHFVLPLAGVDLGLGALFLWLGGAGLFLCTQLFLGAVLSELLAVNRRLEEETLTHLRAMRFGEGAGEEAPETRSGPSEAPLVVESRQP